MDKWLTMILFVVACYFSYDYGHRKASNQAQNKALSIYADRDKIRQELADERKAKNREIQEAIAKVRKTASKERVEAAATTLAAVPIPPDIDLVRRARDEDANRQISSSYNRRPARLP